MPKSIDAKRRASVEATLARQDAGAIMLQKLMRQENQVDVLAEWAAAFGKDSTQAFNRLTPSQVGKLLASAIKAAEGVNHYICEADSLMRAALGVKL